MDGSYGSFEVTVSNIESNQGIAAWQSGDQEVAGYTLKKETDMKGQTSIKFTFTVTEDSDSQASTTYLSGIAFGTGSTTGGNSTGG